MVVVKMGNQCVVDFSVPRESLYEVFDITGLPFSRPQAVVRMLFVFGFAVVSRVDHHCGAVRHNYQAGVTSACGYGVNVEAAFLPLRKVFRSLVCSLVCGLGCGLALCLGLDGQ